MKRLIFSGGGGRDVKFQLEEGYNHSYFTIATFIGEYIQFHVEALNKL